MISVDGLIESAISDRVFPGACYAVVRNGELSLGAVGHFTYNQSSPPATEDTLWDLASLTKVVGTTTAVMILVQEGKLALDQPIKEIIPEFGVNGKSHVTFRNLMVHDSGLVAFRPYHLSFTKAEDVMDSIYGEELEFETGTKTVYSDLSMILVGEAIERITSLKLDEFLAERVFQPLGMSNTRFFRAGRHLDENKAFDCAPTEEIEPWRTHLRHLRYGVTGTKEIFGENPHYIQGEVHDPTATVLNGVAGHAGLFSTIGDLTLFMTAMTAPDNPIVKPEVWNQFTKQQDPKSTRALGWDTKSPEGSSAGTTMGPKSYGHTGYTGTSIWCDPEVRTFAILLTHRVCPTSKNTKILTFRPKFHDLIG